MARSPKEYTIKVTTVRAFGEDKVQKVSGTLEELIDYYSYTLEIGHGYNSRINLHPKTIRGFLSAIQKASDIKYGCTYTRQYFELLG